MSDLSDPSDPYEGPAIASATPQVPEVDTQVMVAAAFVGVALATWVVAAYRWKRGHSSLHASAHARRTLTLVTLPPVPGSEPR